MAHAVAHRSPLQGQGQTVHQAQPGCRHPHHAASARCTAKTAQWRSGQSAQKCHSPSAEASIHEWQRKIPGRASSMSWMRRNNKGLSDQGALKGHHSSQLSRSAVLHLHVPFWHSKSAECGAHQHTDGRRVVHAIYAHKIWVTFVADGHDAAHGFDCKVLQDSLH